MIPTEQTIFVLIIGFLIVFSFITVALRYVAKKIQFSARRHAREAWECGYYRAWLDLEKDPTKLGCVGCFNDSMHDAWREFEASLDGREVSNE